MKFLILIFALKTVPVVSWSSYDTLNFKPKLITLLYLILGLILFGLGETLLITANAGVSPWTVLAQGISIRTGYSIGLTTFFVSIGVLCLWIPLRQKPGIGTILNTIIVSVVMEVSLSAIIHQKQQSSASLQQGKQQMEQMLAASRNKK